MHGVIFDSCATHWAASLIACTSEQLVMQIMHNRNGDMLQSDRKIFISSLQRLRGQPLALNPPIVALKLQFNLQ